MITEFNSFLNEGEEQDKYGKIYTWILNNVLKCEEDLPKVLCDTYYVEYIMIMDEPGSLFTVEFDNHPKIERSNIQDINVSEVKGTSKKAWFLLDYDHVVKLIKLIGLYVKKLYYLSRNQELFDKIADNLRNQFDSLVTNNGDIKKLNFALMNELAFSDCNNDIEFNGDLVETLILNELNNLSIHSGSTKIDAIEFNRCDHLKLDKNILDKQYDIVYYNTSTLYTQKWVKADNYNITYRGENPDIILELVIIDLGIEKNKRAHEDGITAFVINSKKTASQFYDYMIKFYNDEDYDRDSFEEEIISMMKKHHKDIHPDEWQELLKLLGPSTREKLKAHTTKNKFRI